MVGQIDLGPTREQESREEALRVTAVETAWQWLRRHPNWVKHYGFFVSDDGQAEFQASLREMQARIEACVRQQVAREFASGRLPALPDLLDVIVTAAYLLRSGRRPVRPLPSGLGATWRALAPFCNSIEAPTANRPGGVKAAAPREAVSSALESEGWCVDLAALRRPVSIH